MKLPVKIAPGRILLLDPSEIYYIEGEGNHALIRTSRKRRYQDLRSVSAWAKALGGCGRCSASSDRARFPFIQKCPR